MPRPKANPKNHVASAAIDSETHERLNRLTQQMGLTRSEVLEKIIRNGTKEMENAVKIIGFPGLNALFRLSLAFENEDDAEHLRQVMDAIRDHRRRGDEPPLPFGAEAV